MPSHHAARWPIALAFAVAALPAQAAPPAKEIEILQRAAQAYRDAETFVIEGEIESELRGAAGTQATRANFRVAVGGPGKLRDELAHPQAGMTRVSDGQQSWIYLAALNQYAHRNEPTPGPDELEPAQVVQNGGMVGVLMGALRGLDQDVASVTVLPDETVHFGGADRPCRVLEVTYRGGSPGNAPRRFWIDRERHLVLRQRTSVKVSAPGGEGASEQEETFRYTRVSLGQPVPDSTFAFRIPAGAREVDPFAPPGSQHDDLSGKLAADFTLPDLKGKKHTLRAQRGKVVMLDFWASWCGPCRIQMPMVEKLHHEFKSKGLVVFAVNQGESPAIARRYLERNKYTATTLLDQKVEVGREYKVAGIPTLVIIDRQGKIAAHYVGVRSESVLRAALEKAGIQ